MIIGINASAVFKKERTGVEEYTYHLIKNLSMLEESKKHRFILYVNQGLLEHKNHLLDINLPANFTVKTLRLPFLWTQIRLLLELFKNRPDTLFIPSYIPPLMFSKNSIVTIHGLEFEHYPEFYPPLTLKQLRWLTYYSVRSCKKIISPSQSTKNDLVKFYNIDPHRIEVIHHGVDFSNQEETAVQVPQKKYLLYIGRIEKRKNIEGIVKAFEILKENYKIPHQLILIGGEGYGFKEILRKIKESPFENEIFLPGYINKSAKEEFLKQADVLISPSFYEGFGLPILEAQARGVPVVTSSTSSLPEVAGEGAILVNPSNFGEIAKAIYITLTDKNLRKTLIEKGFENVKKFSWQKTALSTLKVIENMD